MEVLAEGSLVADRYTVLRVLGRGGMAVVYEVMNEQLGTPCALKVLAIAAHSVQARLAREGQVQAQLAHPNIVAVFDVVEVGGSPGLLMELVRGPPLDTLVAETKLSFEQCDALATGLLAGLGAAHERGLIHRDLKPANILCSVASGQLIPKIADFGLAKVVGDGGFAGPGATRSGTTMGTPSYMAPEQIRNAGRVDQRADIFSAGAILYELLTGRKAFDGDDMLELFTAIASGRYVPPRELRPDLPARMERAIVGALEPDRDKRIRDVPTLLQVWRGDRDDWTTEADPATLHSGSPWDPSFLARYSVSSASGERPGALSPLRPRSSGSGRQSDATLTADALSHLDELPEAPPARKVPAVPSFGSRSSGSASFSPQAGAAFAGGALVALLALLAAGSIGVGVGVYLFLTSREVAPPEPVPVAVEAPPPAPAPVPEPAPVAEPVPVAAPEPAPVAAPEPVVAAAPTPRPVPRPAPVVEPAPAPVAEPAPVVPEPPAPAPPPAPTVDPTKARVKLGGDVARVWLQGPGGNVPLPATLEPGTYDIEAFFDEGAPVMVGQITLAAGVERTVSCFQSLRKCR